MYCQFNCSIETMESHVPYVTRIEKEVVLLYQLLKQDWNFADVSTRCSGLLQGESKRLE